MSDLSPVGQEPASAGFSGDSLVNARERLGLSVQQAAAELRLPLEHVEALERGDFAKLPSVVFTRGYIRAYARLVKLDGDELVRQFDRCYGGESQPAPIRTVSRVRPTGSGGPAAKVATLMLLVVIVGATFWWWQTQYGHEVAVENLPGAAVTVETADGETLVVGTPEAPVAVDPAPMPDDELEPAPDSAGFEQEAPVEQVASAAQSPLLAGVEEAVAAATVDTAGDAVGVEAVEAVEPAQAAPEEIEDAAPEVAAAEGLFVRFNDECWVTIKDASGKTLFNGMRRAGQELHLPQSGSMSVLLGRVSAVSEITFDGSAVDLAPFSNKNVARLTLPVSQ